MKLFTIPNLFTLGNLGCGCVAIVLALNPFGPGLEWTAYLVGIAAVLDFLDGFVARALKQHSPIGKELDSLADMVTFGVVPGVVMFQLLRHAFAVRTGSPMGGMIQMDLASYPLAFVAFLIPLFSGLRLAKFNVDTRQSDSFIGVPTPANSILICSFPLIWRQVSPYGDVESVTRGSVESFRLDHFCHDLLQSPWFLLGVTVVMSILLIAEIPLFALKVKGFGWKGNEIRYSFLAIAVVLLALLKFIALPLVIVLYILMSILNNLFRKKIPREG